MAKIRKDGFYDERAKYGKQKNRKHTRLCLLVGGIFAIVGAILGYIINGYGTEDIIYVAFGCFIIGAILCGVILKIFRMFTK